ncbi:DUF5933 domain-containing protein [Streptomyces sp. t39]|uniref:DUF5933 domain-containing protein n=1 Tax=Streptomyces sp. t39 TaxID=1828156 RepID=UPI0012D075F0|nr:DUF5933 domain-containing protein [Streptomyces sp. t39]TXS56006.1 hypothetical protein EAO77_07570 [Streptomyces sp. t39]
MRSGHHRAERSTLIHIRHQPRARLWAVAAVAVLGFLMALEFTARRYGLPGRRPWGVPCCQSFCRITGVTRYS